LWYNSIRKREGKPTKPKREKEVKMKLNKRTINAINKKYGVDVTNITTVDELVKAFEFITYKVVMEADLCDDTIHYIEDVNGDIIAFDTDVNDVNKLTYIGLE
jgi:hypothetical protein